MTREDAALTSDSLLVEFIGEEHEVPSDGELTFGRQADLVVDASNPYLHRRLGRFWNADGMWMLQNTGDSIGLAMVDEGTSSLLTIAPGRVVAIPFEDSRLVFEVQGAAYELLVEVPYGAIERTIEQTVSGTATVQVGRVPLTESQKQCIVALAEHRLARPGAPISVPSNKDAYNRLGWSSTKFNRKLDNVCDKLTKSGVRGLQGDQGHLASNRRERLVEHAITTGLVTPDDLQLLP